MHENVKIRIGCPVWSCPHWRGSVYKPKSPRSAWLREYSHAFSTVEGNSTFYAIPTEDTFKRWTDVTAEDFKFVLKFPRVISHERKLVGAEFETDLFLSGLDIMLDAGKLGPSFIQLAPSFGPSSLNNLAKYLDQLPQQFPYAVEVRHPDFFKEPFQTQLNELLIEHAVDRVIFDSRPLFSAPPEDEIEEVSQQRKPNVPVQKQVTSKTPIVRLVGRNDLSQLDACTVEWSQQLLAWKKEGLEPYIFTHTPDDRFAPRFAEMMHQAITAVDESTKPLGLQKLQPKLIQQSLF